MPLKLPAAHDAALVAGVCTALLGSVVMWGWHAHEPWVVQIRPNMVPMQFNTALGFLLGGLGVLGANQQRWALAGLVGALMALMGLLTLSTHLSLWDLGLDELFMRHYITVATSRPGRMAPNTALCFSLTGVALLIGAMVRREPVRWQILCLLSALTIGLSAAALVGYLVGIPTAYGWGNLTRMAVHTAVGFMVLSTGLIALSNHAQAVNRDWLPWAIALTTSTITVTLWQALRVDQAEVGHAADFVLAFGLLMALALARAVASSQGLRLAADATTHALQQLSLEMAERQKAEEKVRQLAFYDMLTGLPNRLLLSERLQHAMASVKRRGNMGALMFLDLDNFKPLNDGHGHAMGDLLLKEVARRLLTCVRETDTVARLGGDEFVVVLSELSMNREASQAQAVLVAEKIRVALSASYRLASNPHDQGDDRPALVEHSCTVSIGMTLITSDAQDPDRVLQLADTAMYRAKVSGRNAIRWQL